MTGTTLAVTLAVVVALMSLLATLSLRQQVRRLSAEIRLLAVGGDLAPRDETREPPVSSPTCEDDLVLTPMPLGPAEVEPDPSVSRIASVTLAGPLIKVAAFSHGVRRALADESRMRVAYAFRKELRRQRKLRRRRAAAAGPPGNQGRRR